MVRVRPKHLYGYRGHHYPGWRGVKIGQYVWSVYRNYSSKAAAEKSLRGFKMWRPHGIPRAEGRLVRTVKGWAVVQRSPHGQYRVKASDPKLYVAD